MRTLNLDLVMRVKFSLVIFGFLFTQQTHCAVNGSNDYSDDIAESSSYININSKTIKDFKFDPNFLKCNDWLLVQDRVYSLSLSTVVYPYRDLLVIKCNGCVNCNNTYPGSVSMDLSKQLKNSAVGCLIDGSHLVPGKILKINNEIGIEVMEVMERPLVLVSLNTLQNFDDDKKVRYDDINVGKFSYHNNRRPDYLREFLSVSPVSNVIAVDAIPLSINSDDLDKDDRYQDWLYCNKNGSFEKCDGKPLKGAPPYSNLDSRHYEPVVLSALRQLFVSAHPFFPKEINSVARVVVNTAIGYEQGTFMSYSQNYDYTVFMGPNDKNGLFSMQFGETISLRFGRGETYADQVRDYQVHNKTLISPSTRNDGYIDRDPLNILLGRVSLAKSSKSSKLSK